MLYFPVIPFYFLKYSFLFCCLQVDNHMRRQSIFIFVFPMGTRRPKGTKNSTHHIPCWWQLSRTGCQASWCLATTVSLVLGHCALPFRSWGPQGQLYTTGGHDGPVVRKGSETYDPRTEPWKQLADRIMYWCYAGNMTARSSPLEGGSSLWGFSPCKPQP